MHSHTVLGEELREALVAKVRTGARRTQYCLTSSVGHDMQMAPECVFLPELGLVLLSMSPKSVYCGKMDAAAPWTLLPSSDQSVFLEGMSPAVAVK